MTLEIRRVITGLDKDGKSTVTIDDMVGNRRSSRAGHESRVIWTSDTTPADVASDKDAGNWVASTPPIPNGSIFRITEYGPGVTSRMHRNDTLDYSVVISGEIDMRMEDGSETHLRAGDVIVQRGTYHDWINRGQEPCIMVFVLLDARPAA